MHRGQEPGLALEISPLAVFKPGRFALVARTQQAFQKKGSKIRHRENAILEADVARSQFQAEMNIGIRIRRNERA